MSEGKRWAPWWVYVLVIVPANLGKQRLLPEDASTALTAASTLVTIGGLFLLVTVVYRAMAGQR